MELLAWSDRLYMPEVCIVTSIHIVGIITAVHGSVG